MFCTVFSSSGEELGRGLVWRFSCELAALYFSLLCGENPRDGTARHTTGGWSTSTLCRSQLYQPWRSTRWWTSCVARHCARPECWFCRMAVGSWSARRCLEGWWSGSVMIVWPERWERCRYRMVCPWVSRHAPGRQWRGLWMVRDTWRRSAQRVFGWWWRLSVVSYFDAAVHVVVAKWRMEYSVKSGSHVTNV